MSSSSSKSAYHDQDPARSSSQSAQQHDSTSSTTGEDGLGHHRQSDSTKGVGKRPTVFAVYYSMYGHVERMAKEVCAGVESEGCDCNLFQVAETLSPEVLRKMGAKEMDKKVPVIEVEQLAKADGILFGIPTRFGSAPTQIRALFDRCGGHWWSDTLVGKPAGIFFSTGSLGGGQETTALTCIPFLAHLGMMYVPLGYKDKSLLNINEVHGGSPYGAGTLAGDGQRQPSVLELQLARTQGQQFAKLVKKLTC